MGEGSKTALEVGKLIGAGAEQVWKALTTKELLEQWFFPGGQGWSAEVDFEPEVGSSYRIVMISPDGECYLHEGEFREVVPRKKLVFSWNSAAVQDTEVTILINEQGNETELTLIHEFMPDEESRERHREGWREILQKLQDVVSGM